VVDGLSQRARRCIFEATPIGRATNASTVGTDRPRRPNGATLSCEVGLAACSSTSTEQPAAATSPPSVSPVGPAPAMTRT
jgi:hypothetical protein